MTQTIERDEALSHAIRVLGEYLESNDNIVPRPGLSELEFAALSHLVNSTNVPANKAVVDCLVRTKRAKT